MSDRLIYSIRSSEDTKKLMEIAYDYGITEKNVTILKKMLLPFIEIK